MIYDFRAKYCTSQIYTYFRIELYCLPSSFLTQRTRVFSSSCVILFDAQISLLSILVFILNDELMSVSCIFLKILSPTPPKLRPFGNKFPSLMATQTNWGHPRGSELSGWYHDIPSFPSTNSKRRVGPRLVFGEPRQMLLENEKKKNKNKSVLRFFRFFCPCNNEKNRLESLAYSYLYDQTASLRGLSARVLVSSFTFVLLCDQSAALWQTREPRCRTHPPDFVSVYILLCIRSLDLTIYSLVGT